MKNLRQLMAAYLHQDWWDEYDGSWEAAVDDFARREPERVRHTIEEIDVLLSAGRSERDLGLALEELGNYRDPGEGDHAYRDWLLGIRARLVADTSPTS